tara:strand:- start:332 stop:1459 length:1128 start_codon:yes stop_codon:yes gene_type:complete
MKKILFITGTRADFGKLKTLILKLEKSKKFKVFLIVTGMHLFKKFGYTVEEVKDNFPKIKKFFFNNQSESETQDLIISRTISRSSVILKKIKPDLVFVHGDRVETMAMSLAASLNNILVAHIEGGEISGTIDEHIRHSVSKLSHIHFVSNKKAADRIQKLGEFKKTIHVVGSPDYDLMFSKNLPSLNKVKNYYEIKYQNYAISIFHPVTTELKKLKENTKIYFEALKKSKKNFIVIFPNNDPGCNTILKSIQKLKKNKRFRILKSMRFEYFLTLLKNSEFIIGNSSAGIREAPAYGVKTINVGSRQNGRVSQKIIKTIKFNQADIQNACNRIDVKKHKKLKIFGKGDSSNKIFKILSKKNFWLTPIQKKLNFFYN